MKTQKALATFIPLLIAGTVLAAQAELSADEMRSAEDTLRDLDSNVSLQNRKALDEARELARFFQQVGAHYTAQPGAARGVDFARKSQDHAQAIAAAVEAGDYDAAQDRLADLTRSCKTCHEVYKAKK
ncbi:cytochrome c553 [Pelomonas saccharophila]|uniref:Cytochrome c553 n=1 Tax=Roseateles saccharophilus TaxID=304 RepID=A0ABU1YWQ1_ROSSA|nr:hypothetical protein [Roseateles saccharophilus]MDR7272660.1 cytochrome c553 [Roseateles saccharophilus]